MEGMIIYMVIIVVISIAAYFVCCKPDRRQSVNWVSDQKKVETISAQKF